MALLSQSIFCSIQCGTSSSYCQSYETCCPSGNGDYSCCPYENGVCCSGEVRCCPTEKFCFGGQCMSLDHDEDDNLAMIMSPSFEKTFMRVRVRKSE